MDREVIEQKLESLRRCLVRVGGKCPAAPEVLATDADAQDIVALNLTRAVQICVDIGAHLIAGQEMPPPETMGRTFDVLADLGYIAPALAVRMKKAVGFRNIAVHKTKPSIGTSCMPSQPATWAISAILPRRL